MRLYHGSNVRIGKIDLAKSRPNKDFGRGFYLTEEAEQAMRMAEQKVQLFGGKPTLNIYEFDERLLGASWLKVRIFNGYSEEWARFVLANRNRDTQERVHDFDIVYVYHDNNRCFCHGCRGGSIDAYIPCTNHLCFVICEGYGMGDK